MSYVPFTSTKGFDEKVSMFVIRFKSGNAIAIPYFLLLPIIFEPGRISMALSNKQKVTIEGKFLLPVFWGLVKHELLEIFEGSKAEMMHAEGTIIEKVTVL